MAKLQTTRRVFFKGLLAAGGVAIAAPVASAFRGVSAGAEAGAGDGAGGEADVLMNQMQPLDEMHYETAWAASLATGGRLTL